MKKTIFLLLALATALIISCKKEELTDNVDKDFILVQDDLRGVIDSGSVTLKSGLTYKLTNSLTIKSGGKLIIEPGVVIEAQTAIGASNLFISVERGGKIEAKGTQAKPIRMTSTGKTFGSWGGLVIHGKAPNNVGVDAASEINGTQYGGNESNDNSGIYQYIIIENSGAKNGDKEFNGMSFFSVGSGTVVDHIAIFNGGDDAFEWYGGTVNCSYLYAKDNDDDNFDYDFGYVGTLEYLYSINTNENASSDSRGIEADGNPVTFTATPITNATIRNISLIGRGIASSVQKEGVYLRRGVRSNISNIFISGFATAIGVEHDETIAGIASGNLKLNPVAFEAGGFTTKTLGKNTAKTTVDVSAAVTEGTNTGAGAGKDKPSWANWF
ncbi:MAG: hypothetical protein MUE53_08205 [Chitinophagales bacterium]|jgi:hypothetical protein|nr:hypothetical protein [Chitinophagales bacterium]